MNINELVASIEVELEAAQAREAKARHAIEVTLAQAQQDGETALCDEDEALVQRSFDTIETAQAQQESIKNKLAKARQVQASEADFDARMSSPGKPSSLPAKHGDNERRTASISVGREERTYSRENDPSGRQFLSDVLNSFATNDVRSGDRLRRHMSEEQVERAGSGYELRATGTGAFSGLVVPQYLVDMVAPAVANLRPFADVANKHPLPAQGMSVNISRITTPSQAGIQATENTAVANRDMDDTLLTIPVKTAAGQQLVSRQAIERGTGIEDIVLQDLFRQYATSLDADLLNGATSGLTNVAVSNDGSSAASATDLYPLLLGAMSQSETATLGMAHPTHTIMHPRRYYWLQSQLVDKWPAFAQPGIDPRSIGRNDDVHYDQGVAGVLPGGLKVIMDANVATNLGTGTNEDEVFVVPQQECHLWEDAGAPVFIRAEQPAAAQLGVLLVVYGYYAYTFQRYANAMQKVTALAAPAGF